jgi:hypothetical protein
MEKSTLPPDAILTVFILFSNQAFPSPTLCPVSQYSALGEGKVNRPTTAVPEMSN